ncbi:sulfatase [Halobacterium sp. KA-6]|uniref:sulfatase n=1 Tax=Halobacterium sp. KA-6 TaxID=2896368 RepID=UPI001E384E4D|nr:sulfatase [Halobacterium sp. KA-6]MCD2204873.1 sulfatase [Halobacterium sp. KA-6]
MRDVLLITIDSLRSDHLGCYGYDRDISPNIDEISRESITLDNAFANGCSTPISFPSILTSSYALHHGGYPPITELSENRSFVSEPLAENGYRTVGIHSNPHLFADLGYGRGFSEFFDSQSSTGLIGRLRNYLNNNFQDNSLVYRGVKRLYYSVRSAGFDPGLPYVRAEDISDMAIEAVETGGNNQFIWAHYMDVHNPFVPPSDVQEAVNGVVVPRRRAVQLTNKLLDAPEDVTDDELDVLLDLYDAEIQYTDREVGRLIDRARTELENPLIIITSDHGEEFLDHGGSSHGALYDEIISVPLIVYDGEQEGIVEQSVSLIDIAPTILDYLSIDTPSAFDGESFRPLITEQRDEDSRFILSECGKPGGPYNVSCRYDGMKYIYSTSSDDELYNIRRDPSETKNLFVEQTVPQDLKNQVDTHLERIKDEMDEPSGAISVDGEIENRLSALGYK